MSDHKLNKRDPRLMVLKDAIFENGADKDVTKGISPNFFKFNRNGIENVSIRFASKLSDDEVEWAFELVKGNMEDVYDASGYGWDDDDKKGELTEDGARFLLLQNDTTGELIGFVHFRFTVQGEIMDTMAGELSLHLWDIHILEEYQRKGLGKHILIILELIARQQKMAVLSVPIQFMDNRSISWITSIRGFAPDVKLRDMLKFDPEMEVRIYKCT